MRPLFKPLRWWGWLVVLGVGGMVLYTAAVTGSAGTVTDLRVRIQGEYGLFTVDEMTATVKGFYSRPLAAVQLQDLGLGELEDYLDKNAFVEKADVYVDALRRLHVDVVMREPVVRLMDYNGNSEFVDAKGVLMPVSEKYAIRVPVVTGMQKVRNGQPDEARKWMGELMKIASAINRDEFMVKLTEQIHLNEDMDFVIIPKIGRERIILGDASGIDEKIDNLKLFYKEGIPRTGFGKYSTINLKINNQVIAKLKKT